MPTYGDGLYGHFLYGSGGSTKFELVLELDLTNAPTESSRVWTRVDNYVGTDGKGRAITNRVRSANWTRDGRTRETERTQPGQATVVLDNRDGIFDRNNASGPFYGPLDWAFWFRISIAAQGVTYARWTGIKTAMPGSRPSAGKDRYVTLTGMTPLQALELYPLSGLDFVTQNAGPRVSAVLAAIGFAAGSVDNGKTTLNLPDVSFAETDTTTALSHLQAVEQNERGLLFSDADGTLVFQDRYHRANLQIAGPGATIGETDGDIRYVESDVVDDATYLWNECEVDPPTGTIQVAVDSASETSQFKRRLVISSLVDDDAENLSNAQWYVYRFAQPLAYLNDIEIVGARDASTWATILAAGNSDLFNWQGGDNEGWYFLERVSESFRPGEPLGVTWSLAPAGRDALWKLGVAGLSELGATTKVG